MTDRQTTSAASTIDDRAEPTKESVPPDTFESDNQEQTETEASKYQEVEEDEVEPDIKAYDRDTTAMASTATTTDNAELIDKDLWFQLYHHILLIAALQPTKPVAWLYNTNQIQYFDAYLNGQINSDGIIGQWPTRRDIDGTNTFKDKCNQLVPRLQARIRALSNQNWEADPENQDTDPSGRQRLWKFIITPEMISQYREIRESIGAAADDEIVDAEAHPELPEFLEQIIAEQYDVDAWVHKHTGRKIVLKQRPRLEGESFEPSEGRIVVHFEGTSPTGTKYQQQDTIPEIRDTPIDTTGRPERFIVPEIKSILVPFKSKKGYSWKYRKGTDSWSREDGLTWTLKLILREFRTDTSEYIGHSENMKLLEGADPNNHDWYKKFNAWVNQWSRRHTKTSSVSRKHWTVEELAALYRAMNAVIKKDGMDAHANLQKQSFRADATAKVNAVQNGSRPVESIRSMMKRKSGIIFDMFTRAKEIKARIDAGEAVSDNERYPEEAIPIPKSTDARPQSKTKKKDKKVKHSAEEDVEDELSDAEDFEGELGQDEEDDITEALRRSKQDLNKRKRRDADEEDGSEGDEMNTGSRKKRPHTKAEEDAAQAAAKVEASRALELEEDEDNEDDGFFERD